MQTAIEAELTEFLGSRPLRPRRAGQRGSRNGHCPTTITTTARPATMEHPKLRGTDEVFESRLLRLGVVRASALESLVIARFVRGLSAAASAWCGRSSTVPAAGGAAAS